MKNLPLGFALVLAAAILIERGWGMFGGTFGGSADAATTSSPVGAGANAIAKGAPAHESTTANRRLGHSLLNARYPQWARDPRQWVALDRLWTRESGWNDQIKNASSGAAGIPQDISGNLHGGAAGQILWGLAYIKERYGSPLAAWEHELSAGWY